MLLLVMSGTGLALPYSMDPSLRTEINPFKNTTDDSTQDQIIVLDSRPGADVFKDVNRQLQQQNYKALIRQAQKYISRYPKSGLAHEVLGTAMFMTGNKEDALKALEQAVRLEPRQSGPYVKLGIIHMESGNLRKAQQYLERAIRYRKDDRIAHQRLGMLFEYKKEYDRAIDHLRKGIAGTRPSYLGVTVNLGRILNKLNRFEEAVEVLEPRLPLDSPVAEAHLILATAYYKIKRYKAAQFRFERVLLLQPESDAAKLGIGMSLRQAGDPQKARKRLEKLVAERPEWRPAIMELAETMLVLDDIKSARKLFDKGIQLGTNAAAVNKRMAAYHLEKKEFEKAEALFRELVRSGNADPDTYAQLSELLQAKGNYKESVSLLKKGLEKYPENWYLHFRLGSLLASLRQYDQAVPELQNALQHAPNDPMLLRVLSLAQAKSGDTAGSVKTAARLYDVQPGSGEATFYATRLEASGQPKRATAIYRKALASQPDNVVALNNLAILLSKENKLSEAEKLARKANDITEEKNGILMDTLGWIWYQQERFEEAASLLDKASRAAPKVGIIRYHYGMSLLAKGNNNAARKELQRAVSLDSNAEWAERARAQLEKL
jgi:tetratricopeptide (TPR) repeat protein